MTRHWHPTLERIVRWLKPSAESFAAAAAVYGPDLMLQLKLEATCGADRMGAKTVRTAIEARCPAR